MNNNARIRLLGLSAATALLLASCSRSEWPLASPGRGLVVTVFQRVAAESPSESGRLFFRVELNGREVLADSPLGVRQAGKEFAAGLVFAGREDERIEETYPMVTGKKSIYRHVASQMTLSYKNPNGEVMRLVFRAADDGVAFRYDLL